MAYDPSHDPTGAATAEVEVVDARDPVDANAVAVPEAPTDLVVAGEWDRVKKFAQAAREFGRAQVACQVMAGLELLELRKRHKPRAGRPTDPDAVSWADLVAEQAGISDESARRWIAMAEGVRPRLKKLPGVGALFRELLERPLHELTVEQHHLLEQAVHKATDGMTQIEFLRELGIAKLPPGHGVKGGARGGGRPPKSLVPPSEEEMQAAARSDWGQIYAILDASRASFAILNDFEVDAQIATLELHVKARKAWLRVPKKDRSQPLLQQISEMFRVPLVAPLTEAQMAIPRAEA